ncbi:prepilin peptidase [uncultured Ruegeria sp.]|uniref:prepilin peptidase n=1 Tax=uncultured Ruegeria sp. TaxID=259304 RepID=UPI0026294D5C|nr:prepilin peptidase [uncultured Ruegeria sp.]
MILHVTLLSIFLLLLIAEDVRAFEINYAALAVVALAGVCLNLYLGLPIEDMLAGGLVWGLAGLLTRWILGRHVLGQGDLWLLPVIGALAGLCDSVTAIVVLALLCVVTMQSYRMARARPNGRRSFSLFPAALPGALTIFGVLAARIANIDISFNTTVFRNPAWWEINTFLRAEAIQWGGVVTALAAMFALIWMVFDRHSLHRGCSR